MEAWVTAREMRGSGYMSTLRQSLMPRGNEKNVHTSLLKPQSCTQLSLTWTMR